MHTNTQSIFQDLEHTRTHTRACARTQTKIGMYTYIQRLINRSRKSYESIPIPLREEFCLRPSLSSILGNWVSPEQNLQKQSEFRGIVRTNLSAIRLYSSQNHTCRLSYQQTRETFHLPPAPQLTALFPPGVAICPPVSF